MVKIPVGKLIKLLGALIKAAPGGVTSEERDQLVTLLLEILADIIPDEISVNIGKK